MPFKNDMTMMYVMHDALRRELQNLARITSRTSDDPRRILRTAVGWELFKKALLVHHTAEDDALWPVMQEALAGRPDDLALLAAMEAEHAAIDPLLDAIDAAVADPESGAERIGELADALTSALTGHLKHEESDALVLIDATVTEQQWTHFGEVHSARIGPDAPRVLPWLMDGASPEVTAAFLGRLPEPARQAYQNAWQPAHAQLDLWAAQP